MSVFGTRPEAIKMAPLVTELGQQNDTFQAITVVTGQHREMLDQVLKIFKIIPDYDLDIMHSQQTLTDITANVLQKLDRVIEKTNPDIILVHGDTTTTFAASLAAFYHHKIIGHVEAGLRTWNKESPYPEEMNRQLTDGLADLYFAPTGQSKINLLKENHDAQNIFITGNTAIDALKTTIDNKYHHVVLDKISKNNKLVLITMHRRENQGLPIREVFSAIREVVSLYNDVEVVYPVHLNPVVQETAKEILAGVDRVHLIEPLDVVDFHNLAAKSYFIMTDSGGIQEEAPTLGKPVLVLRDTTERPEGLNVGTLKLVGTDRKRVKTEMIRLLTDKIEYERMATAKNPYGDGNASSRILAAINSYFNKSPRPKDFGE